MVRAVLFVEDDAHDRFLSALISRICREVGVSANRQILNNRGGFGTVLNRIGSYVRRLDQGAISPPDLLIVGADANCQGTARRRRDIVHRVGAHHQRLVCATPDPHIERWMLVDSHAFKSVLGIGCTAPVDKCEKNLFKKTLIRAVEASGISATAGGMEYAEDIVHAMDLERAGRADEALNVFLRDLRAALRRLES